MEYRVEVEEEVYKAQVPPKHTYSVLLNGKHVWRFCKKELAEYMKGSLSKALEEIGKESDPTSRVLRVEKAQKIY